MINRLARSWTLLKASGTVLRADKELLLLPMLSGAACIALLACFMWLLFSGGLIEIGGGREETVIGPGFYVLLFCFYVVQYFVIIFFNAALVGAALLRLDGRNPTLAAALAISMSRVGPIFGYALVSATIGVILRTIAERLGFLGRIVETTIGLTWTVATFLVIPVLVVERIGPVHAIKRSASLLRETWGENLVGSTGVGFILGGLAAVIGVPGYYLGAILTSHGEPLGIVILAVTFMVFAGLMVLGAALTGVYSAALYYYATLGTPKNFDADVIRGAFRRKDSD